MLIFCVIIITKLNFVGQERYHHQSSSICSLLIIKQELVCLFIIMNGHVVCGLHSHHHHPDHHHYHHHYPHPHPWSALVDLPKILLLQLNACKVDFWPSSSPHTQIGYFCLLIGNGQKYFSISIFKDPNSLQTSRGSTVTNSAYCYYKIGT